MWVNAQVNGDQCSGGKEARHGMTGRESGPVARGQQGVIRAREFSPVSLKSNLEYKYIRSNKCSDQSVSC